MTSRPVHRQMALAFPTPDHMPCPDCGASVPVAGGTGHVCDDDRRLDFRLAELRPEIERFDGDYVAWLDTPEGRFARFIAEHDRP
jgi:hypothetical protein